MPPWPKSCARWTTGWTIWYSAIKYYLTKISRAELDQREGQRWTEVINFTINMEQVGDLVERILQEIEDKKIKKGRDFSSAGLEEINEMHAHLVANLHLAMSVFLNGNVRDAQRLLKEKGAFSRFWNWPTPPAI